MLKHPYRYLFLFLTVILSALYPSRGVAQDGSTAYGFLEIPSSARAYGLGGVNISTVEPDITLVGENPGLLGPEMDNQLAFGYMHYLGGSNFAGVTYGRAIGEHNAWSAAIRYFGYGSIKGADEWGNLTGDFSPKDLSFSATYAHDIVGGLRGGVALKFLYSGYEQYTALAVCADLGINYYDPDHDLSLSLMAANLGGQVKRFAERYDRLPVDVRLGLTKGLGSLPMRFSITAWHLTHWKLPYYEYVDSESAPVRKESFSSNLFRHLVFGLDFTPSDRFYINLGYNYKTKTDMKSWQRSIISGFTLGAGLNMNKFGVGLAFAQPHSGATTLMLNLRVDLNDFIR